MNKKVLSLTLSVLSITGLTTNAYATINATSKNTAEVIETVKVPNRYEAAGITNAKEFEKTFDLIKSLVKINDKINVANYINYPLGVNTGTKDIKIVSKEEFIKKYDDIITSKVKNALLNQDVTKTLVNAQGVMVGNGEMWLGAFDSDNSKTQKYLIFSINQ